MPPRAAESQSESEAFVSDPSQRFVPREDDDENLFEVIEITGETKDKYKVRWKGNDPKTKKPWAQSWVPKRDCTNDLLRIWKRTKKEKERKSAKKSGRDSTSSKRSAVSTTRIKSRSKSNTSKVSKRRKERSPSAGPSSLKSKSRPPFEEDVVKEEDEFESADDILLGRQERASVSIRPSNVMSPTPPSDAAPKGTKRKREAQSANSSTNQPTSRRIPAVSVDVDSDEGQATKRVAVLVSNPPRKKRRLMSHLESPSIYQEKKERHDVRNGGSRLQVPSDEGGEAAVVKEHFRTYDEEGVGMVGVAHSDGYHIAGMNDESRNDDLENGDLDGEKQQVNGKQKGKDIRLLREEEEESDDVEFLEPPDQLRQSKVASVHVRPSKGPSPRMMEHPAPSNKLSKRSVITAGVPELGSKALDITRPAATTKKSKDSFIAQSSSHLKPRGSKPLFEPDSDADNSPLHRKPPLGPGVRRPRIKPSEIISIHDSDDSDVEACLSPRALQRLAIFDAEVMGKKIRAAEKKRVREVNDSKRSGSSGNSRPAVPAVPAVRPTQRFETESYNMDVVPETELETSQEDKLQTSSVAVDRYEKRDHVAQIASSTGPSTKSLRPLPHISPSTFHAHLQPPNSSLPDTIMEPSSSHERRPEIEAIEQFDSPEKERIVFTKSVLLLNKNSVVPEARQEPTLDLSVNQKESAEDVRESGLFPKKKTVQEVVAISELRTRSESNASQADNNDEEEQCEEEGVADASTSVVPPASGPPALSQDQPPPMDVSQSMEDNPNGLDGGVGVSGPEDVDKTHDDIDVTSAGINPELLRQEEEENTQDIMAERRQHRGQEEEEEEEEEIIDRAPSPHLASINGDTGGLNTLEEPKLASRPSSRSRPKSNQPDDAPRGPITRSRSRSKTPLVVTNNRNPARGKKKALQIPSPVPSRRESPEPELPKVLVEVVQNVQESSPSIFDDRISSLQTQVREKQVEIDSLRQVLDSLREELRSSEDRNVLFKADMDSQMAETQIQWANEKSGERALHAAQIAVSEQDRIQAEQDREFFREQYGNASAYVTTVREENKELEQRVKIAEEQSKKGVELIKATFELQVAKLQDDAKTWRRMAEFAIQKDIQTNDDIRKRAAEEPELRMLCVRQQKSLKEARMNIDELEADLREKTSLCDASTEEIEHCKKENARLHSDLNEALIKLDRLGRSGDESNTQSDDHEFVYRCMWRVETDNTQSGCPDVFSTMRELEQHLLTGHLAPR